jgi:hypothetical protein
MGGSRNGASFSEGLWGRPFIGDPDRYVKKGSGYGHLSPQGPFTSEGNLESGGGLVYWGL